MSAQASLFEMRPDPLPARSTDPATSRAAARSVDNAARKAEVLDAMWTIALCNDSSHCTASEIHDMLLRRGGRMDIGSVRSRLAQLRDEEPPRTRVTGGVRTVAKPAGSGRPEQVWALTDAGKAWCAERGAS